MGGSGTEDLCYYDLQRARHRTMDDGTTQCGLEIGSRETIGVFEALLIFAECPFGIMDTPLFAGEELTWPSFSCLYAQVFKTTLIARQRKHLSMSSATPNVTWLSLLP